jgi:hypothetical protein
LIFEQRAIDAEPDRGRTGCAELAFHHAHRHAANQRVRIGVWDVGRLTCFRARQRYFFLDGCLGQIELREPDLQYARAHDHYIVDEQRDRAQLNLAALAHDFRADLHRRDRHGAQQIERHAHDLHRLARREAFRRP